MDTQQATSSQIVEEYEAPVIEEYEEQDDAWTFSPCGGD
jgi:hypothetical protein